MIKWEFSYKGKHYWNSVKEEPTSDLLALLFQNAQEVFKTLKEDV